MKTGDVIALGRHRLMCGDAGNPDHVDALFGDDKPALVFTSPPYAQQRAYTKEIGDWDTLMRRVFGAMPWRDSTQVLVNLGLVHLDNEWQPYWGGWIEWMRTQGWRRFGWYVWDQGSGIAGDWQGRFAPCFEFVFHFNRTSRKANKAISTKGHGRRSGGFHIEKGNPKHGRIATIQKFKIQDSVLRCGREYSNRTGHPAVFPITLPSTIYSAFTAQGDLVYEPFAGSGTSILAAEKRGRICYAMEIAPEYCDIIRDRWDGYLRTTRGAAACR